MKDFKIYIVRNKEGKFFRVKGRNGYGESWVEDINKAKVYTKIGQARSRVSFFFNNWSEFGIADILELHSFKINVLHEQDRVNQQKLKKAQTEANYKKYLAQRELNKALKKLEEAQKSLDSLVK